MKIEFEPIGTIRTPFIEAEGTPIQPTGAEGIKGTVEVDESYCDGLADLDGFSHIVLLYFFDRVRGFDLTVVPFLDENPRGLFATRAPRRPNAIGLSVVKLVSVSGCKLEVENVDMLDGTPLLDIKPYVSAFDPGGAQRTGWVGDSSLTAGERRADGRFSKR